MAKPPKILIIIVSADDCSFLVTWTASWKRVYITGGWISPKHLRATHTGSVLTCSVAGWCTSDASEKQEINRISHQSLDVHEVTRPMCGALNKMGKKHLIVAASLTYFVKHVGNDCTDISQHVWANSMFIRLSTGMKTHDCFTHRKALFWQTWDICTNIWDHTPTILKTHFILKEKNLCCSLIYLLYLFMDVCLWHVFIYLLLLFFVSNWACVDELCWVMVHWLIVNQRWTSHPKSVYPGVINRPST